MKRTLLLSAFAIIACMGINAQTKIWNLGGDPTLTANGSPAFPLTTGIGIGDGTAGNPAYPVNINGLSMTGTFATPPAVPNPNMGTVEASAKAYTDVNSVSYSFANRFKFNGGGYPSAAITDVTPTVNMPTQRFFSFVVNGNSTLRTIGMTGSSNTVRRVFVTDGTNLIGTWKFYGAALVDSTFTYTGGKATLYVFCNQANNLYYLSATNVVTTAVSSVLSDKGVSFNGTEILNNKGLAIEVYSVLGKRVAVSKTSIPTANFQKGVYIVRISGSNDSLKICI